MNKIHLLIILFLICLGQSAQAQYYSVNYDKKTVAAMAAAYNTEAATEAYYNEQVQNILKHYNAAEVATAGIFASKFLDRAYRVGRLEQQYRELLLPPHL